MSSATLQRLEQLLSRVQERRGLPRSSAVPASSQLAAVESRSTEALESPFSSPPPSTGRVSKVPVPTPLEESMDQLVPVERVRETQPNPFAAKPAPAPAPDSEELFLDDFEPPPTIAPAAFPSKPAPVAIPAAASVPTAAPAPAFRAEPPAAPAPITAPTARIAAAPIAMASPVAAVSKARSIEPKSFGELLDLSLSLRPSK